MKIKKLWYFVFEIALKLEKNFVLGRSAEGLPVSFASLYRYNMHQLRKGVKFFQSKYLLEVPSCVWAYLWS